MRAVRRDLATCGNSTLRERYLDRLQLLWHADHTLARSIHNTSGALNPDRVTQKPAMLKKILAFYFLNGLIAAAERLGYTVLLTGMIVDGDDGFFAARLVESEACATLVIEVVTGPVNPVDRSSVGKR